MAMLRLANFSDEVTEGQKNVRMEEGRAERGGWFVNSWRRYGRAERIYVCCRRHGTQISRQMNLMHDFRSIQYVQGAQ